MEAGKTTSLAEYISRMPSEQKEIYFVIAPSREAAEASPYYEVLAHRKYEALFLHDPWDEFVMEHLCTSSTARSSCPPRRPNSRSKRRTPAKA